MQNQKSEPEVSCCLVLINEMTYCLNPVASSVTNMHKHMPHRASSCMSLPGSIHTPDSRGLSEQASGREVRESGIGDELVIIVAYLGASPRTFIPPPHIPYVCATPTLTPSSFPSAECVMSCLGLFVNFQTWCQWPRNFASLSDGRNNLSIGVFVDAPEAPGQLSETCTSAKLY